MRHISPHFTALPGESLAAFFRETGEPKALWQSERAGLLSVGPSLLIPLLHPGPSVTGQGLHQGGSWHELSSPGPAEVGGASSSQSALRATDMLPQENLAPLNCWPTLAIGLRMVMRHSGLPSGDRAESATQPSLLIARLLKALPQGKRLALAAWVLASRPSSRSTISSSVVSDSERRDLIALAIDAAAAAASGLVSRHARNASQRAPAACCAARERSAGVAFCQRIAANFLKWRVRSSA